MPEDALVDAAHPVSPTDEPTVDSLPFSPFVGCLVSILVGLAGVAVVFTLAKFVINGELRLGTHPLTAARMWMISDDTSQGIAWSSARVVEGSLQGDEACVRTQVRFWLWRSDGSQQNLAYCECYTQEFGRWTFSGECPD